MPLWVLQAWLLFISPISSFHYTLHSSLSYTHTDLSVYSMCYAVPLPQGLCMCCSFCLELISPVFSPLTFTHPSALSYNFLWEVFLELALGKIVPVIFIESCTSPSHKNCNFILIHVHILINFHGALYITRFFASRRKSRDLFLYSKYHSST